MKAQTHRVVDTLIDEFMELQQQQEIIRKLDDLSKTDSQLYGVVTSELISQISKQGEEKIQMGRIFLLETIVSRQNKHFDQKIFKTCTIYQLVAVAKGYLSAGFSKDQNIKGPFIRNLKKDDNFWAITQIQNLHNAVVNKSCPTLVKFLDLQIREYVWSFLIQNQQILPPSFDINYFVFRHLLSLRPDIKKQQNLLNKLTNFFLSNPYHLQILTKNFRFGLQFFRNTYNEKQTKIHPQITLLNFLKNYSKKQLDHMFDISSLGLVWNSGEISNCINNTIKLGITEQTYRLLTCFIMVARKQKKYNELIQVFNTNLPKIFIFLKHPPLFQASLKTLKEIILGPWAVTSLFSTFSDRAIQYWQKNNKKCAKDFNLLIHCVIEKYKETTITDDLKKIVQSQIKDIGQNEQLANMIKQQLKLYDWKAFSDSKKKDLNQAESIENGDNNRGIVNIGNSCYMNSFLQCLFMTKEYRRQILEVSTLQIQGKILQKLRKLHPQGDPNQKNLPTIARQTVRPLAQLQRFFSLLLKSKRPAINPTPIKNVSPNQFQNVLQHDSIQFGRFLIESISRAEIKSPFQGQSTIQIQCPYCHAKRQRKQQFLDILLHSIDQQNKQLPKKTQQQQKSVQNTVKQDPQKIPQTITNIFENSLADQHLDGLICEKCNNKAPQGQQKQITTIENVNQIKVQKRQSIKRHWISKYPNYMVLTLKRFQYDFKLNKNMKKKFSLELSEKFMLGKIQYFLYSIIIHRGSSANSGHYFTFAKQSFHPQSKAWLCLNDSTVSKMQDFEKVIEFLSSNEDDTPYILFACQEQHRQQKYAKIEEPLILRPPLQNYIDKDDMQYAKSLSKGNIGNIDLSLLKFATGNYIKRDDQDDGNNPYGNNGFGGGNNPIM